MSVTKRYKTGLAKIYRFFQVNRVKKKNGRKEWVTFYWISLWDRLGTEFYPK